MAAAVEMRRENERRPARESRSQRRKGVVAVGVEEVVAASLAPDGRPQRGREGEVTRRVENPEAANPDAGSRLRRGPRRLREDLDLVAARDEPRREPLDMRFDPPDLGRISGNDESDAHG